MNYSDVDLGKGVHGGVGYISGPETFAAVRSKDEWTRVWKRIADTVQTPKIGLDDSIILVLATKEFTSGPFNLDVLRVRLCRKENIAAVEYRLHTSNMKQDYGDRAMRAIAVPRAALGTAPIRFVQMPDKVDP